MAASSRTWLAARPRPHEGQRVHGHRERLRHVAVRSADARVHDARRPAVYRAAAGAAPQRGRLRVELELARVQRARNSANAAVFDCAVIGTVRTVSPAPEPLDDRGSPRTGR